MADFEKAVTIVLKHEGGYVNHPSDPGGATNRGIIFTLFKRYAIQLGVLPTLDALKSLTEEQAKTIYRQEFWDRMHGDSFASQAVAEIVFDGLVNHPGRALKMLQKEIGVEADGVIGNNTLAILNGSAPEIVFNGYKDARIKYYTDLAARKPNMKVFLAGWLNRINSFKYQP